MIHVTFTLKIVYIHAGPPQGWHQLHNATFEFPLHCCGGGGCWGCARAHKVNQDLNC
jgi:hypothetical protein